MMKVVFPTVQSAPLFSLSSSASDRNSPWHENAPHTHSRSHSQHLAIAPHDLSPLHISDANWYGATSMSTTQSLLSATSSSSSSTFPCPSRSSSPASTAPNTKPDLGMTPTNAMFKLSLGYELMNATFQDHSSCNRNSCIYGGDLDIYTCFLIVCRSTLILCHIEAWKTLLPSGKWRVEKGKSLMYGRSDDRGFIESWYFFSFETYKIIIKRPFFINLWQTRRELKLFTDTFVKFTIYFPLPQNGWHDVQ